MLFLMTNQQRGWIDVQTCAFTVAFNEVRMWGKTACLYSGVVLGCAESNRSAYDRQTFDQLSSAMPLDRHQLTRPSYHQSLAAGELPYDRRMAMPSFQSQQPAMAHQPPQQPPYSNLFAVDPLLQQLRAANMMYRVDYWCTAVTT